MSEDASSTVPPVIEYLLPLRMENFPPVEFNTEELFDELLILSSPEFVILTVPPEIWLSGVFRVSFDLLSIFVVPPDWFRLLY